MVIKKSARERAKDYYWQHRKERLECAKEYRKKNKEEIKVKMKKWRKRNKGKYNEYHRRYYHKLRLEVLTHYGGSPPKCACCPEGHIEFLSLDHIHGGGNKERKKYGVGGLLVFLRKNNFPDDYQVLCRNCNWAKSHGGCPHQREKNGNQT